MKKLLHIGKKAALPAFIVIALVIAIVPSVYFYTKYQETKRELQKTPAGQKEETAKIVALVAKLLVLPTGEEPTLASVTDKEKLKDQPFFAKAENGDKVLIYTEAKKAILYRPSQHIIVEVAAVNLGTPSATVADKSPGKKTPYTFVLYNGTDVTGFTKTYEATLKASVASAVIVDRDNAAKRDYDTSMLVDLSGTKSAVAAELAKSLGMAVSTLPAGETKPMGADFLIILGKDKK